MRRAAGTLFTLLTLDEETDELILAVAADMITYTYRVESSQLFLHEHTRSGVKPRYLNW